MKSRKVIKIVRITLVCIIWIYVAMYALLNLPAVRQVVASRTASLLSDFLETEVNIGSINPGFLNNVTIDDLSVKDREGKELLTAARVAATINLRDLADGQITLEGVQLFGITANLRKATKESEPNFQFIIDALSSDNKEKTPLRLKLSSVILRHANINYDVESEPVVPGRFTPHHVHIADAALTAAMTIKEGELYSCVIRRMDATETISGLTVNKLTINAKAVKDGLTLNNIELKSNVADISMDSARVAYTDWCKNNKWSLHTTLERSRLSPKKLQCLIPQLKEINTDFRLKADISGNNEGWDIRNIILNATDRSMNAEMDASYSVDSVTNNLSVAFNIDTLWTKSNICCDIVRAAGMDDSTTAIIRRIGDIGIKGTLNKFNRRLTANARITTTSGMIAVNGVSDSTDNAAIYKLDLKGNNIELGQILNDNKFGTTTFAMTADGVWNDNNKLPVGTATATIANITYKGYDYNDITLNTTANGNACAASAQIDDNNIRLRLNGKYNATTLLPSYSCKVNINDFNPNALHLTDNLSKDTINLTLIADIKGSNIDNATGTVRLDSTYIFTPEGIYINDSLVISQSDIAELEGGKRLTLKGDFIDAEVKGMMDFATIGNSVIRQLSHQLPAIFNKPNKTGRKNDLTFDITMCHSEALRHLLQQNYNLGDNINLSGKINDLAENMDFNIKGSKVTYNDVTYRDISINGKSTYDDRFSLYTKLSREEKQGLTEIKTLLKASNNAIDTQLSWKSIMAAEPYQGLIDAHASFTKDNGTLATNIRLKNSDISIKDMTWSIQPSSIDISNDKVIISNFKVSHDKQHITANGTVSKHDSDSLDVKLCELPIEYLQDLANFHPVDFGGKLSGNATLKSLYSSTPNIEAQVRIDNMHFEGGRMGEADLHVWQNARSKGINIEGIINDTIDCYTGVSGFVSPADKEINLLLSTHNTSAAFLNGLIGSIFDDIQGRVNGDLRVCGPLGDISLIGDVATNVNMTLRPTNVRYSIEGDTLHFRQYRFGFDDVTIKDQRGNRGTVNGSITHKNLKNFGYTLDVDMHNLLCYDESEFNSDKFYATVFANGSILIKGADKEPLSINGTVTTGRGSVFAYDAATPDAISSSNFITFRDRTPKTITHVTVPYAKQHEKTAKQTGYKYSGDIRMNLNIDLNNNCEIKLRMDNTDDGYMSTYGHGNLQAIYHNKSPFKLHGTYHIDRGSYRLFLQDLIFRDLAIQNGSQVDFDGDPFAAELHLICHHTLNSVPLSDLTASTAYSYNNKVKVICILDITGTLANMNFKFDLDLPNVNEETKQLVRSMINSEDTNSSDVSSLMSSTLSGQINQMLSNAMGKDSKWNFGTGLSTGERGWEDLDVEGILSGRLFNDRLLINGNFGYRDNSLTQTSNFVGDFDVRWKITETGNTYIKAYNQANDRYFTKATLNTQGIGISYERNFENWTDLFRFLRKRKK